MVWVVSGVGVGLLMAPTFHLPAGHRMRFTDSISGLECKMGDWYLVMWVLPSVELMMVVSSAVGAVTTFLHQWPGCLAISCTALLLCVSTAPLLCNRVIKRSLCISEQPSQAVIAQSFRMLASDRSPLHAG